MACRETCTRQCTEDREAAALELQGQLCTGECVGQPADCLARCVERRRPSLLRTVATECRFAFCGGTEGGEPRTLGEICLLGDQVCEYEPDQRKHGTKCAAGLACVPRTEGDRVGRCLLPGSDVDTAPLVDAEAPEAALAPTGRWAGPFVSSGAPGCPRGAVPRRVCMALPRGLVSAERADHLGPDAPVCFFACRPAQKTGAKRGSGSS